MLQRQAGRGDPAGQGRPGLGPPGVLSTSMPATRATVGCGAQTRSSRPSARTGSSAGLFSITIESTSPSDADQFGHDPERAARRACRQHNLAVQYAPVRPPDGTKRVPGLIVGEPVQARTGLFELYYLFPLTAEQQTIALVQRTVLLVRARARAAGRRASRCWSPGRWCVRSGSPRRPPDGWPRVTSRSASRCAAPTTSPGSAGRSTTWPAACSARSAGWRICRDCSAASPATSRTSCAPR